MNLKDFLMIASSTIFVLAYFMAKTDLNRSQVKVKIKRLKGK